MTVDEKRKRFNPIRLLWLGLTVGVLTAAVAVLNALTGRKKRKKAAHEE